MTDSLRSGLEEIYDASLAWAVTCCRYDRNEAEDVLQMTYLKILEKKAVFDGRSALKTWLFAVIRRTAAERRRMAVFSFLKLGRLHEETALLQGQSAPDPEKALSESEGTRKVRAFFATLPTRQREVLELVFYQELTIEEAASVMGVSLGTARIHYHRGKKRCQQSLAGEET